MEKRDITYKTEYDVIRLIAIIFVIYNHSSDPGFRYFTSFFDPGSLGVTSWKFWPTLFFSITCKTAVPLFFMISGALLLGREESYGYIFKHRILKYVVVLLVFSGFYFLVEQRYKTDGWLSYFKSVYSDGMIIPFWFLYAYISFLFILPLLRKLVKNLEAKDYQYIFILVFVFQCVIPIIQFFVFSNSITKNINLNVSSLAGNVFLFPVLGYGISKYSLNNKQRSIAVVTAIIVTVLVMIITRDQMVSTGLTDEDTFSKYFSCCCLIQTVTLFSCLCSAVERKQPLSSKKVSIIQKMAGCVFGIYLIHMAIMNKGWICYDIMTTKIPSYLSLWIYIFIIFFLSMAVVFILKKIPGLKKLL